MISIIIPVYNAGEFLRETVLSVLEQDYKAIELILVNDGSKDDSLSICNELKAADDRIIVIDQPNAGVSTARNNGLKAAKGEYVLFVDADDLLEKDMVSTLYNKAVETSAEIVSCGAALIKDGLVIKEEFGTNQLYTYTREEALKFFLIGNRVNIGVWTKLFKKSVIEDLEFRKNIRINEDKLFIFEALMKANKYVVYDVSKYRYIQRASSATRTFDCRWFDTIDVADLMLDTIRANNANLEFYARINQVKVYYWLLLMMYRNKNSLIEYKYQYDRVVKVLKGAKLFKMRKFLPRNMWMQIFLLKVSEPVLRKIKVKG